MRNGASVKHAFGEPRLLTRTFGGSGEL